ncbi:hypothetical protein PG988_013686 [Apiospora saccharicola]
MSLGFGIGDFIAVGRLAQRVRKDFAGAPEQFQQISSEVRSLTIVIGVSTPIEDMSVSQIADLAEILEGCRQVLETITAKLNQYCEFSTGGQSHARSAKRAWKRLKWEPDDIRDLRSQITSNIALLNSYVQKITLERTLSVNANVVKLVDWQDDQRHQTILKWLMPADMDDAKLAEGMIKREPGTGQWFFECAEYQQWMSTRGTVIFCPGIPGAGKTILSSIILQTFHEFSLWLMPSTSVTYCRSQFITELKSIQADLGANIVVTSRFIPEIESQFEDAFRVEVRASELDIRQYLDAKIPYIEGYVSRHKELHDEIKQSIIDCVDGMFLLALLHLDSLGGKSRVKAVRTALGSLAKGSNAYDDAYKNAMTRINGQVQDQRELTLQNLSWIVCARRPLKPEELRHALGVEMGESDIDEDNLPDLQDVLSSFCGLVKIDAESDVVRLVHYTTQQYFERTQETWFPHAQPEITKVCLTYLNFDVLDSGWIRKPRDYIQRLFRYPLYNYASNYWGFMHARFLFFRIGPSLQRRVLRLPLEHKAALDFGESQPNQWLDCI